MISGGNSKVFNINLLADGFNWRVFWDQEIPGKRRLQEIFTVTYHTEMGTWSPVTQVTDTATIMDDYNVNYTELLALIVLTTVEIFMSLYGKSRIT